MSEMALCFASGLVGGVSGGAALFYLGVLRMDLKFVFGLRGHLPCPHCGKPLSATRFIHQETDHGERSDS